MIFVEASNSTAEPHFTLQFDNEDHPGEAFPRSELLDANQRDPSICNWLKTAAPGASERFGGRDFGCTIRRVS